MLAAPLVAPVGCSNSPPRIEQIELHVVHAFDTGGAPAPVRLMVFVDVSDLDGEGEIAALELRANDPPVRWRLDDDALQPRRRDGQSWYGSADLVLPGGLVPDSVAIEVADLSGRSDTRRVAIPRYDPRSDPPRFSDTVVTLPAAVSSAARWFANDTIENAFASGVRAPPGVRPSVTLDPHPIGDYWIVAVVAEHHWLVIGPVSSAPEGLDPYRSLPAVR